jgi:hypothetical protein
MPSQATLPSLSDVWGILPLRVESELTAQKLESWRRWGLSEQFGPVSDNSSGERTRRKIVDGLAEQARRYSRQIKVFSPKWTQRAPRYREDFRTIRWKMSSRVEASTYPALNHIFRKFLSRRATTRIYFP